MEIKTVLRASLVIIGIGLFFIAIYMILQAISVLVKGEYNWLVDMVNVGYTYLMIPIFIVLYFWAGYRAVRKYGLDAIGAGAVSAFSYLVIGIINLVLGAVLNLIAMSRVVGAVDFRPPEAVLAAAVLGEMEGLTGVAGSVACGIGLILLLVLVNFVWGAFGGLLAQNQQK